MSNKKKLWLRYYSTSVCPPCKIMSPIIDQLKEELDYIEISKVDLGKEEGLAEKLNIKSVPTFIVYETIEGIIYSIEDLVSYNAELDRKVGFMTKAKLKEWIEGFR